MNSTHIPHALLAAALAVGCTTVAAAPVASPLVPARLAATCWQPALFKDHLPARVRAIVAGTDAASVKLRTNAGLPAIAADSVAVVTADSVCAQVGSALEQQVYPNNNTQVDRVLVVRIGGTRFAAYDARRVEGALFWYVLDASYQVVAGVSM